MISYLHSNQRGGDVHGGRVCARAGDDHHTCAGVVMSKRDELMSSLQLLIRTIPVSKRKC